MAPVNAYAMLAEFLATVTVCGLLASRLTTLKYFICRCVLAAGAVATVVDVAEVTLPSALPGVKSVVVMST